VSKHKSTVADRLLTALQYAPGHELPILQLYRYSFERDDAHMDQRRKQQALGKPISILNKRLKRSGQRIQPGRDRGTYALVKKGSA
jgi:hypothetical protein